MSKFLEFIQSDIGVKVCGYCIPALIMLFTLFCKWVASKVKSRWLKKAILILPDAMILAEETGTSPSNKLDIAVNYIKDRIKRLSKDEIISLIEEGITISKNVNSSPKQEDIVSSESRISIPERRIKK